MPETKHTLLNTINTGNFRIELSRTERGAEIVTIIRSFFYTGKVITQKVNFLLRDLDELRFGLGEVHTGNASNGQPSAPSATPGQDSAAEAAIKGD